MYVLGSVVVYKVTNCSNSCYLAVVLSPSLFVLSVLAALAGAVPFIGPYWFSLPAILDLWLLDDRPLTSLLVFILFLIPSFVIEPVINSEIKG